jgi:hypothetical protein
MDGARQGGSPGVMTSDRRPRLLLRIAVAGFAAVLCAYACLIAILALPEPLFRHERGAGLVTFHATRPLPPEAESMAREVTSAFVASPLGLPGRQVDIWLVDEGWQARLFFSGSLRASGLTYPVLSTRNVFLRHADLAANRLRRGDIAVPPPRTLSYYLIHEITHLMVADRVGAVRIVRMPRWINEGFADYVALGPAPPQMVALAEAGVRLPARHWGTYARERVCVTLALARLSGDLDALFALDVPLPGDAACPVVPQFGIAGARTGT